MQLDEQYSESFAALSALAHVRHRIWTVLDRELQARESAPVAWFEVLWLLAEADEPRPMNEVASALLTSPSGMTRMVDRIEAAGLVRRLPHPSDRRVILIGMTDAGHALLERVMPHVKRVVIEEFGSRLSEEQARSLRTILEQLLQATDGLDENNASCDPDQISAQRKPGRPARAKTGVSR